MSSPNAHKIAVVSGLGNAQGTGAATARLLAQHGYRVALVSRPRSEVNLLQTEITRAGGVAHVFSLDTYDYKEMERVFRTIGEVWTDARISFALWNTGAWSMIPFLEVKEVDIQRSVDINIVAATAFAQAAVRAFTAEARLGESVGGTLIFTGATSAWRGAHSFGAFAAGKHGLRALSQSIAREYGPRGVHVAFVVIDGTIRTKRTLALFAKKAGKQDGWLHDDGQTLNPDSIARTYLYLHEQTRDAWTLEMDLRPSQEKF